MTSQNEDAEQLLRDAGRVHAYGRGLRARLGDLVVHPLDEEAAERVRAELSGELGAGRDRKAALASLAHLRAVSRQPTVASDEDQCGGGGAA